MHTVLVLIMLRITLMVLVVIKLHLHEGMNLKGAIGHDTLCKALIPLVALVALVVEAQFQAPPVTVAPCRHTMSWLSL